MTDHVFKIEPGSTREDALRHVVNNTFGMPLENFKYDPDTGVINVTSRAVPAFGELDPESEQSKLLQSAIDNTTKMDAAVAERERKANKRDKNLDKKADDLDKREKKLKKDREDFEKEKKTGKKPTILSKVVAAVTPKKRAKK